VDGPLLLHSSEASRDAEVVESVTKTVVATGHIPAITARKMVVTHLVKKITLMTHVALVPRRRERKSQAVLESSLHLVGFEHEVIRTPAGQSLKPGRRARGGNGNEASFVSREGGVDAKREMVKVLQLH